MEKLQVSGDGCPTAPAPRITVHTRVLHRACQILGGVDALADYLNVSTGLVYRWLEGEDAPPASIFLKVVDLILPTWTPEDDALAREIAANRPRKQN